MNAIAVARAYADAIDRGDDASAARVTAEDIEVVFPGGTVHGRAAWLDMRSRRPPPEHVDEGLESAAFVEAEEGCEMRGRLVQRWTATGEIAAEQPIRVQFTVVEGLIRRIVLSPRG